MKKVLYAWIEQIIQFDSKDEVQRFFDNSKDLVIVQCTELDDKYIVHLKKPYNRNKILREVKTNEFWK